MAISSERVFVDPKQIQGQTNRIVRLATIAMLLFGVLLGRLWQIQIMEGRHYQRLAAQQSSRVATVLPQRGLILDRDGKVLVDNQPGLRLRFHPDRTTSPARTLAFLTSTLSFKPPDLEERFETALRRRPYRPETLVEQLTRDDLAKVAARRYEFPSLELQTAPLRRYPYAGAAAHLFGYLGEIDDREIQDRTGIRDYAPGDIVGKQGVERVYDPWLFGTKGREVFRVDARGRVQELLETTPPRPGWDLRLTIHWPTQQMAERALGARAGAVVALDPRNGAVLAIASHPTFDPALFVGGISQHDWAQLRDDPEHPMEYRPVRGLYPPGSTFKPLTALAALAEGVIDHEETIHCPGHYRLGRRVFRCWKAGGHGKVDLHKAIVQSCDTYFYEIGRRLGIEALAGYARRIGLGQPTGIDFEGEKDGLVPDPDWKRTRTSEPWQQGETIITAIGQGSLLATPLQMAGLYATLANGGHIVSPHLRESFAEQGRPAPGPLPPPLPASTDTRIDPVDLDRVREALVAVVNEPRGTGGWARLRSWTVAGKTGTAQVVQQAKRGEELTENLRDHAWFVAYAPANAPEIVVAVIVEHGGHGGDAAAPVARKVLRTYLERETTTLAGRKGGRDGR